MVQLTLKQCGYFIAVAEHGGIAQAARALHISQPAVAQALGKLEQILGLRLILRHHARGTELTPQGRAFLRSARDLLRQADRAEAHARALAANLAGTIRFGCFHTIAPFHLARLVKAYGADRPDVQIAVIEAMQDEIVGGIEAGDLDLALTYDMSLEDCVLERRVVARLRPFVLLSDDHPLAARPSVAMAELAREPLVVFDGPSSREYFDGVLRAAGIRPTVSFRSRSLESVRSAVANGFGFSLSVMPAGRDETHGGGRVVSVAIDGKVEPLPVVLVSAAGVTQPPLIEDFAEFCEAYLRNALLAA